MNILLIVSLILIFCAFVYSIISSSKTIKRNTKSYQIFEREYKSIRKLKDAKDVDEIQRRWSILLNRIYDPKRHGHKRKNKRFRLDISDNNIKYAHGRLSERSQILKDYSAKISSQEKEESQSFDERYNKLLELTKGENLFLEYYSHTNKIHYKINSPYSIYQKHTIVLSEKESGINTAIDNAIKALEEAKSNYVRPDGASDGA